MTHDLFWQLSYHLCGIKLLKHSPECPLGSLPIPIRTAVLHTVDEITPGVIQWEPREEWLPFSGDYYRWFGWWRFREPELWKTLLTRYSDKLIPTFESAEAYFDYYHLNKEDTPNDEHYAERRFVKEIFTPTCGVTHLQHLYPQVGFKDSAGKPRRIDFVLRGNSQYAVEIEGATWHDRPEKFPDESERRRELTLAQYSYYPIAYSDVNDGKARESLEKLIQGDTFLRDFLQNIDVPDDFLQLKVLRLVGVLPTQFPIYQVAVLSILQEAFQQGKERIVIVEQGAIIPVLALAIFDSIALLENVGRLTGIHLRLPEVDLFFEAPVCPYLHTQLLNHYLYAELHREGQRIDRNQTAVRLHQDELIPDNTIIDYRITANAPFFGNESHVLNYKVFQEKADEFARRNDPIPPANWQIATTERRVLDYFTRRYFPVPELKSEQLELVQRSLRQESSLGILPTGFGKSLVFQLYSLLIPRTVLIISPLKSLMHDQVSNLRRLGFSCVESITSTDTAAEKSAKLKRFSQHQYRLFYISPERLQIKGFYEEIRRSLQDVPIGALVVDETHCVSEWGHDFRPAYLKIPFFRDFLQEATGRKIPIIALTATASEPVRLDVLATLELAPECLIQLSSSDRSNFSLSVHPVDLKTGRKKEILSELILRNIPNILKIPFKDLVPISGQPIYLNSGIIFGVYADSHGQTTIDEGIVNIANSLQNDLAAPDGIIQIHSSTTPTYCPKCGSYDYIIARNKKHCRSCNSDFQEGKSDSNWDKVIINRQEAFQDNQFPLLVATKGYGMGIDKRNIRFVVHHAFASGLESYYQEAGRAGRDNHHAHIALIYAMPVERCVQEYIKSEMGRPPCVTDPESFRYYKCPYELPKLCDYGRQSRFIEESYLGIEHDCENVYGTYKNLKFKQSLISRNDKKNQLIQLALYRLLQLGIVQDYFLNYQFNGSINFDIRFNNQWKAFEIIEKVKHFLIKSKEGGESLKNKIDELENLADGIGQPPWPDERGPEVPLLKKSIGTLIRRIYESVPKMRYLMLRKELEYARSEREGSINICRRVILRSTFDKKEYVPKDDFRCDFCDVCIPDLQFTRHKEGARIPHKDIQIDEIAQNLPAILTGFNIKQLNEMAQKIKDRGAIIGMSARITGHLEGDVTNLAALYLAGILVGHDSTRKSEALGYLKYGFGEGYRQGLPEEQLIESFYKAACSIDTQEAFGWLSEVEGRLDNPKGLIQLQEEAHRLFGPRSSEFRSLKMLQKIRVLTHLNRIFFQEIQMLTEEVSQRLHKMEKISSRTKILAQ